MKRILEALKKKKRKIFGPMGWSGRGGGGGGEEVCAVQCRVRGTSAPGWPNTKDGRLPIRKPLKPPTVNRKKLQPYRNSVVVST